MRVERPVFGSEHCGHCTQRLRGFCALTEVGARSELRRISHTRFFEPDETIMAENTTDTLVGIVVSSWAGS